MTFQVLRITNLTSEMETSDLIYHLDIAFDILNSLKAEVGSGILYERAVRHVFVFFAA